MSSPYEDIIHLPHYVSPSRKRMSMTDRGAQFSPFAALTGYDAAIRETGRLTDRQIRLGEDARRMVDEKLQILCQNLRDRPEVTVCCFVPDLRKEGGTYEQISGRVKKLDPQTGAILLENGQSIPFTSIRDIQSEVLRYYEGHVFDEEVSETES